jgi:rhamnogalacturonyl hydrolase YesR
MAHSSAELIAIIPDGDSQTNLPAFLGHCINYGIDFYFEPGDALPAKVPAGVLGVRGVVIDQDDYETNRATLEEYSRRGARVHVLRSRAASGPQLSTPWDNNNVFHQLVFHCGLTVNSPRFREKMLARSETQIFESLENRMLQTDETRWYDATRYNWEGLLSGYEVTGDERYLNLLREQIRHAMGHQENHLENCDCVAPFTPMLRLYQMESDEAERKKLLDYAQSHMDRYLEITPRYKGCLVNFLEFDHAARAEIALHVCPALMHLWKTSDEYKYADFAFDQLEKLHALLFDPQTNLWHHGVSEKYSTAAFWSRGVAFVMVGLLDVLEVADRSDPRYQKLLSVFQNMATRVRDLQDDSGFWFQIVDDPRGEKESSGTAWNAATFERAMRLGLLDASFRASADAAWDAVKTRIWDGQYPGHATGTTVSPIYNYYSQRPLNPTAGWTHFPFLPACERQRIRQAAKTSA